MIYANPITGLADDKTSGVGAPELQPHPVADLMPPLSAATYAALRGNISACGLMEPIWIHEGKILDGRYRYRACRELGIQPRFQEWDECGSMVTFVLSVNDRWWHLTEDQRAMIAAKAKMMFEEESRQAYKKEKTTRIIVLRKEDHGQRHRQHTGPPQFWRQLPIRPHGTGWVIRYEGPELQSALSNGQINSYGNRPG